MPAIGDLLGARAGGARSVRIGTGAITDHNLDRRVPPKPISHDRRLPAAKHFDRLAHHQVNDDSAVPMAALDRPVVDTDHHRWCSRRWTPRASQHPQNSVAADGHAQTRSQASCRRSAQGVVQRAEGFIHPPPAAMPRRRQRIWLLSECSLGAARVDAFEPANLDANQDTQAKTRLIGELASVATMSARTGLRTARTRRRAHRGSRVHPEVAGPVVPSFDTLASRVQQRRQPRNASHSAFAL